MSDVFPALVTSRLILRAITPADAHEVAKTIWRDINLANLNENILPTRERANVVLRKRADHSVGEIRLRQI